jgi:hypothetical protein
MEELKCLILNLLAKTLITSKPAFSSKRLIILLNSASFLVGLKNFRDFGPKCILTAGDIYKHVYIYIYIYV